MLLMLLGAGTNIFALGDEMITENHKNRSKIIDVPYSSQTDIVFGCEAVSGTMLLNYYGYEIDKKEFTDQYLIQKDWYVGEDKIIYGPDPNSAYVGNPYIDSGLNCGFGCFANATAKSIDLVLEENHRTKVTTGMNLADLVDNYIDQDIPVLVWATMDMKQSYLSMTWTINYADEDSPYKVRDQYTWIAGEHCLVFVGYDEENYYFNDPYKNHGLIGYNKELVTQRFWELGKQSLVILPQ